MMLYLQYHCFCQQLWSRTNVHIQYCRPWTSATISKTPIVFQWVDCIAACCFQLTHSGFRCETPGCHIDTAECWFALFLNDKTPRLYAIALILSSRAMTLLQFVACVWEYVVCTFPAYFKSSLESLFQKPKLEP